MKKLLLLTLLLAALLASCTSTCAPASAGAGESVETPASLTSQSSEAAEPPAELSYEQKLRDIADYRTYFFGKWRSIGEESYTSQIDDSENADCGASFLTSRSFFRTSDGMAVNMGLDMGYYYVKFNQPGLMFYCESFSDGVPCDRIFDPAEVPPGYYYFDRPITKESSPTERFGEPDEPLDKSCMSNLKLAEIAATNGFDDDLLLNVTYVRDENEYRREYVPDMFGEFCAPVYLREQSETRLVFETVVGRYIDDNYFNDVENLSVSVVMTKQNGEWTRTVTELPEVTETAAITTTSTALTAAALPLPSRELYRAKANELFQVDSDGKSHLLFPTTEHDSYANEEAEKEAYDEYFGCVWRRFVGSHAPERVEENADKINMAPNGDNKFALWIYGDLLFIQLPGSAMGYCFIDTNEPNIMYYTGDLSPDASDNSAARLLLGWNIYYRE